jgi:membrane protein CcdC involved in cytochrome C biogenesis
MKVLVSILLLPLVWALHGFVLVKLWLWFIVPIFHLPVLSLVPAIGVGMVMSFLTHQTSDCKEIEEDPEKRVIKSMVTAFTRPLLTLLFAWLLTLCM